MNDICNIVDFEHVDNLGMSLFHGRVGKQNFEFVVDKVRRKLNGWDAKKLSIASKSIMLAIPNYILGTIHLPVSIYREIEKLAQNFIWDLFR